MKRFIKTFIFVLAFSGLVSLPANSQVIKSLSGRNLYLEAPSGGVVSGSAFQAYDGYLTVTATNQTGGAMPAGSRITRGMVWLIGEREN